jgi:hypothetical protein
VPRSKTHWQDCHDGIRTTWPAPSTDADAYQPVEGRYRLTRRALEVLLEFGTPVGLVTKSPLILRDVDLLSDLARVAHVRVWFTITTLDANLWRRLEPGTANPLKRLQVLRVLREAGVAAGVFMAPILPSLTDTVASIEAVAAAARAHGAVFFGTSPLRLMPPGEEAVPRLPWPQVPGAAAMLRACLSGRIRAEHLRPEVGRASRSYPRSHGLQRRRGG